MKIGSFGRESGRAARRVSGAQLEEKKRFLLSFRQTAEQALERSERSDRLRSLSDHAVASLTDRPIGRDGRNALVALTAEAAEADAALAACLIQALRLRAEVEASVASIPDRRLRDLLRLRYLDGLTWEEIAAALTLDLRWVYRLHRRALEALSLPARYIDQGVLTQMERGDF